MKDGKATVYTIGIFSGADPVADPSNKGTSDVNKFMHAVSSNYPERHVVCERRCLARAWKTPTTTSRRPMPKSSRRSSTTSHRPSRRKPPYPTEIHKGYDATKSGYITFTDELGDFMQVDGFTEVVINGMTFDQAEQRRSTKNQHRHLQYSRAMPQDLVITVQRADEDEPWTGDIVTVKIPASLIPQSHFKTEDGKLSVDSAQPIQREVCLEREERCARQPVYAREGHGAQGLHRA
ncbi:MAG: hypothetical protein ACLUSU_05910 [Collinsella sp.]